jgi:hypothetical protein
MLLLKSTTEINYFSLCLGQEQNNNTLLPVPVIGGLLCASY